MRRKTVLFLEWSTRGRDFEIVFPLMYFFENYLNWKVVYKSIFDQYSIIKEKPDIVIMSNATGAKQNVKIAKFVTNNGFLLFTLVSEGMFRENSIKGMLWGWNREMQFYEEMNFLWSDYSYNLAVKYYPELKDKLKVSGSTGHDKYKIYNMEMIRNGSFKKTIGYACYDFEHSLEPQEAKRIIKRKSKSWYELHISYIPKINHILKNLIERNGDTLFILKNHPGSRDKLSAEIKDLDTFNNVLIISDEYSIAEVINSSDIWLNYRSSTNLEAWLLGKPSISFCTDDTILEDTEVCYGSLLCQDIEQLNIYIDEYYSSHGIIEEFDKKKGVRDLYIKKFIGFSDGLNHVRFASFLKPIIESKKTNEVKWNVSIKERTKYTIVHLYYILFRGRYNSKKYSKFATAFDLFRKKDIVKQKQLRYPNFDKFYSTHGSQIKELYENFSSF